MIGLSLYELSDRAEATLEASAENYFSQGSPSVDLIVAILSPTERRAGDRIDHPVVRIPAAIP